MSATGPAAPDVALMGYADRWSVAPGEAIRFMVSSAAPAFRAEVVRLRRGGPRPGRPSALAYDVMASAVDGEHSGRRQALHPGSYGAVAHDPALPAARILDLRVWVYPTAVANGRTQGLLAKWDGVAGRGWQLAVDGHGHLTFRHHDAAGAVVQARVDRPLLSAHWHHVGVRVDLDAGTIDLHQELRRRLEPDPATARVSAAIGGDARLDCGAPWLIAAGSVAPGGHADDCFNGKLDAPVIETEAGVVAAWDFARDFGLATITDTGGGGRHGRLVNAPMRAVTGHDWTGEFLDHRLAPQQYGAIHFHDDDLEDAGWEPTCELTIADDWPSGLYALRVTAGADEDLIPFAVRPAPGTSGAAVAVVLPTFTYMAYANFLYDPADADWMTGGAAVYDDVDAYIWSHPELGFSMYNAHTDGSGIAYGSRLRPMLDIRPDHGFWLSRGGGWALSSDMYLIDWLEASGISYDLLTDDDVHAEGAALLGRYRAVLTGAHPEYTTVQMLDAYEHYAQHGGRIMYLGGNGFYWVTTVLPDRPHVIEIRRGHAGTRTWESAPGEVHHSSTGEPGGLWRHRGRAPQVAFGVGFSAQGGGGSAPYEQTDAARDPRAAFIFAGVDPDELIGTFGNNMDGAAGDEVDRLDYALGTPPHALLLATSSLRHSDRYQRTVEEVPVMLPGQGGTENAGVRADLTYFETPEGGAVFSTGSIDWTASLSHNGYDNNVARITGNVLQRFLDAS